MNMICTDCKEEKSQDCFSGRHKHCRSCHYLRYKDKPRSKTSVECPNCKNVREMRTDAYKLRKTDRCNKCSPLFNEQLYKSDHGLSLDHPLYLRWCGMKRRCKDVAKRNSYLDKGIAVCDEWQDYRNFYNWSLENGFDKSLELDRIDNDKGYSPDNCQWITHRENLLRIRNPFGRTRAIAEN